MPRFWWPSYDMQLLQQLQKQQNNARFCDTLMQTEGISIPIHSCVLAALSPYLAQRLSDSPSPPVGQKRQLYLQEVTAQTLLKLVGLLYSGELEVRSVEEQNDVLAAAHKFGISDLVLGCRDEGKKGAELMEQRQRVRASVDAQVQTERSGGMDTDPLIKRKSSESVGTETVNDRMMLVASPTPLSIQTAQEKSSSAETVCTFPSHQNTTAYSLPPHLSIRAESESTAERCADCIPRPSFSSASSRFPEILRASLNDDAGSTGSHVKNASKQSLDCGEGVSDRERPGQENRRSSVPLGRICRERRLGEGKVAKKSHFTSRGKNMEKMKLMERLMDAARVTVKMKLKRGTKGKVWRIVADAEETASDLPSLKQICPNQKTPQADLQVVQTPARSRPPVQNTDFLNFWPVFFSSPRPPKHASTSSDSEAPFNSWLSANLSSEPGSESLSPRLAPLEESDEQIHKLLEDLRKCMSTRLQEGDCKKLLTSRNGVQVPAIESGLGPAPLDGDVGPAGFGFYQDLERPGGHLTTDTAIHSFYGAQNQPGYTNPSAVHPDLQTGQQQPQPSEFSSSIRSFGQMKEWSCEGADCEPYPVTCYFSGTKLHCFPLEQPFSQEDQSIEFLSLSKDGDTQSANEFSLPSMHDFRLPQCLSPLEPCAFAPQPQRDCGISAEPSDITLPWLTEDACTLQFSLRPESRNASQPAATNSSHGAEPSQRCMKLKPKNDGARGTKHEMKRKSGPVKRRRNNQDSAEDTAPPKRKRKRPKPREESEVSTLGSKSSEVRDAVKTACSVSLSYKNVLLKEREKSTSLSSKPPTASAAKKPQEAANPGAEQTRMRTRAFVKRAQRNASDTVSDKCCILIPVIHGAAVVQKQDRAAPKRKRGRPPKIKLEEKLPKNAGANDKAGGSEESGEKPSEKEEIKRCSEDEDKPGKVVKTTSPEADDMTSGSERQKPSVLVTLKEFKKLIKRQHSKTRKGTEIQDRNKSVDVGNLEKSREEANENEVEMDKNDGAEIQHQAVPEATVDENHNVLPNSPAAQWKPDQQDGTGGSETAETRQRSALGPRDKPASSWDALEEDKAGLSSERELAASPDQDRRSALSGCSKKDDDDEEVDVMLCSPDKKSSTLELEDSMVVIPEEEEEEEEDVVEIDVTGDEAE